MNRTLLPILLPSLAAAALYLATPQAAFFSDGPHMLGLASTSPVPHYNVLYVPTGYAFHAVLHEGLGVDGRRALEIHTAVCAALGILFTGLAARRVARSGTAVALALALLAVTPATWFFATTIEVHGVQFAAASFALWAALRARASARPLLWIAAAWLASVLGHLTCVLLAPFLLGLAITGDPARGLTWRRVLATGLVAALAVAAADLGVFLWTHLLAHERGAIGPGLMLWSFTAEWVAQLGRRGLFLGDELLEYLDHEFWRPAFLLLIGAAAALPAAWRAARPLLLVSCGATLVYLLVFTQGGVWERGAYYLSLFPAYTALIAVGLEVARQGSARVRGAVYAALALAVGVQGHDAWRQREAFGEGLLEREWAARVLAIVPAESLVYTDELPRAFCLDVPAKRLHVHVIRKQLDRWPEEKQVRIAGVLLESAIGVLLDRRDVYFDADLFDTTRERRRSVRSFARAVDQELAKTPTLRREPVRDAEGRVILYRVRLPSQD